MALVWRIALALAVVLIVGLVCLFLGTVMLPALGIPVAVQAGAFLAHWAWPIGAAFGLFQFATGRFAHPPA